MAVLRLRGVSKNFGAIQALSSVDLQIERGEVLGLMGDNGAGKSTLVKMVAGNFPPSSGEIRLDGRVTHFHNPDDARNKGIEVVYQDLALCDNLTAAANVFLGREIKRRIVGINVLDHRAIGQAQDRRVVARAHDDGRREIAGAGVDVGEEGGFSHRLGHGGLLRRAGVGRGPAAAGAAVVVFPHGRCDKGRRMPRFTSRPHNTKNLAAQSRRRCQSGSP